MESLSPFLVALAETPVSLTGMEAVITAMSDVFTLVGTVVTQITSQPILLFCLAASLATVGIRMFSRLRRAATA